MSDSKILFVQPVADGWRLAFMENEKVVEVPLVALSVFEGPCGAVKLGYFVGNGTVATNIGFANHEFHNILAIQVLSPDQVVDEAKLLRADAEFFALIGERG